MGSDPHHFKAQKQKTPIYQGFSTFVSNIKACETFTLWGLTPITLKQKSNSLKRIKAEGQSIRKSAIKIKNNRFHHYISFQVALLVDAKIGCPSKNLTHTCRTASL
jgi:hypothetical protein